MYVIRVNTSYSVARFTSKSSNMLDIEIPKLNMWYPWRNQTAQVAQILVAHHRISDKKVKKKSFKS